ncbi:ArgP/LysG family DNA-binding transcriptional regulator [Herbiconiux liukaitaii]|uniref:ArgP/LysG family DNA-binding transcriptional regulator n=1 Tax=Herbiconiux liukaitaii TaxID=3342799 RepID=UPI0035B6F4FB
MELDHAQLAALNAAVGEGTFEAAARRLRITPSAVSQRIRALESSVGRVLLTRSKPIRATESGQVLLRLARQLDTLTGDVARELEVSGGRPDESAADAGSGRARPRVRVPLAVNADSLATWLLPALAGLAGTIDFEFHREDESHTTSLLRDGTVMAAVSAVAEPVQGCTSTPLGVMRYRPVASRAFAARWFPELALAGPSAHGDAVSGGGGAPGGGSAASGRGAPGGGGVAGGRRAIDGEGDGAAGRGGGARRVAVESLRWAPVVVFDRRDELQDDYLRLRATAADAATAEEAATAAGAAADVGAATAAGAERTAPLTPPRHFVPASVDFVRAVAAGYGWGMVPDAQRDAPGLDLVDLDPTAHLDVPLFWQQWQLRTPTLDLVAATVATAARAALRAPIR